MADSASLIAWSDTEEAEQQRQCLSQMEKMGFDRQTDDEDEYDDSVELDLNSYKEIQDTFKLSQAALNKLRNVVLPTKKGVLPSDLVWLNLDRSLAPHLNHNDLMELVKQIRIVKEKMVVAKMARKEENSVKRAKETEEQAQRAEDSRLEAARLKAARLGAEMIEAERIEDERIEAARVEAARIDDGGVGAECVDGVRAEIAMAAAKVEAARSETAKVELAKLHAAKLQAAKVGALNLLEAVPTKLQLATSTTTTSIVQPSTTKNGVDVAAPNAEPTAAQTLVGNRELVYSPTNIHISIPASVPLGAGNQPGRVPRVNLYINFSDITGATRKPNVPLNGKPISLSSAPNTKSVEEPRPLSIQSPNLELPERREIEDKVQPSNESLCAYHARIAKNNATTRPPKESEDLAVQQPKPDPGQQPDTESSNGVQLLNSSVGSHELHLHQLKETPVLAAPIQQSNEIRNTNPSRVNHLSLDRPVLVTPDQLHTPFPAGVIRLPEQHRLPQIQHPIARQPEANMIRVMNSYTGHVCTSCRWYNGRFRCCKSCKQAVRWKTYGPPMQIEHALARLSPVSPLAPATLPYWATPPAVTPVVMRRPQMQRALLVPLETPEMPGGVALETPSTATIPILMCRPQMQGALPVPPSTPEAPRGSIFETPQTTPATTTGRSTGGAEQPKLAPEVPKDSSSIELGGLGKAGDEDEEELQMAQMAPCPTSDYSIVRVF